MQSIFSIKDSISKKELREISALFGVTATQVYITLLSVTHLFVVCYLFQDVISCGRRGLNSLLNFMLRLRVASFLFFVNL